MKRFHVELALMARNRRHAEGMGKGRSIGYFRKRDAYDCGNTRCGICHPEKRFGHKPTRQELAVELKMKEQQAT